MRWVTVLFGGVERVGVVDVDGVHLLDDDAKLLALLAAGPDAMADVGTHALRRPPIGPDDVALRAPVPAPPSVRDFLAFEQHLQNTRPGGSDDIEDVWYEQPVFYFSNPAAIRGPGDDVPVPPGCRQLDYELELAVIVGRGGADLTPDEAAGCIGGYTILCDWSARDLQFREQRVGLGPAKGKDSSTSLGPWLVTPDELADRRDGRGFDVDMTVHVNGIEYTTASFAGIYWSFEEMLAYASQGTRLEPGDVIGSGTVTRGCILELSTLEGHERYPWLRPGDEVTLAVERLGSLSHRIVAGRRPAWDPSARRHREGHAAP